MTRGIRGVALVVTEPVGTILMLEEFESKPHLGKYAGMTSIPMETCRPGEPHPQTLARLVEEELPGLGEHLTIHPERIGWYRIVPRVWVALYRAEVREPVVPGGDGGEVGNYVWQFPADVLGTWLRQGAREMVEDFVTGCHGVVRRVCQAVEPEPIRRPRSFFKPLS